MTPQAIQTAIATACGWKKTIENRRNYAGEVDYWKLGDKEVCHWWNLPDYQSDLNAAIQFCDVLAERFDIEITRRNDGHWHVEITEPSREYITDNESLSLAICEAGLRALNLWIDDK